MARNNDGTTTARLGHDRRAARPRLAAAVLAIAALSVTAACTNAADVATNDTAAPGGTSAPGSAPANATEEPGTTVKKRGTTSTSAKRGTTSTAKKRGTTTTEKSSGTTIDVDTPPEAEAFCAEAADLKETFDRDEPETDDAKEEFFEEAVDGFNALTELAPDDIADDMNTVNDVFQSATSFEDLAESFGDDLEEVTDRIDAYMLKNCGFEL